MKLRASTISFLVVALTTVYTRAAPLPNNAPAAADAGFFSNVAVPQTFEVPDTIKQRLTQPVDATNSTSVNGTAPTDAAAAPAPAPAKSNDTPSQGLTSPAPAPVAASEQPFVTTTTATHFRSSGVPVTRLSVGNAQNTEVRINTGRGGLLGSDSGSVSGSGVSIGSTLTGGAAIVPGSTVEVGNSNNVTQTIESGRAGNGLSFFGLFGGDSGSVANSGSAVGSTFNGGFTGTNFAGSAIVGNVVNVASTVGTGNGGFAADSGSITTSGNSVNTIFNAAGATNGVTDVTIGVSSGGTTSVTTGDGRGFGGSGSVANAGSAIGSSITA